jgi:hypothetical protein
LPEFLELIETIRAEDAEVTKLFNAEDGKGIRSATASKRDTGVYKRKLVETAKFMEQIVRGRRPVYHFQEALTTSDFPLLFGDIIDRMVLGGYTEWPKNWTNFTRTEEVPDFRTVSRHFWDGAMGTLSEVPERTEYPEATLTEGRYQYSVKKYGRAIDFSWEMMVNNDLNFFNDIPDRFGAAAARTEARFVTDLYVGTAGPDATFFAVGNKNIITGNPALSIAGLQKGFEILTDQVDADGHPIFIDMVELVVPPALEITAMNILNALQLELVEAGGTTNQKLIAANWMKNRVRLTVDPYISQIATSNQKTSWFLFANPRTNRPAIVVGRLRGHATPEVFIKESNQRRVGGGLASPLDGDFETDSIRYKVRMVTGGVLMDPKAAVASNGSGV